MSKQINPSIYTRSYNCPRCGVLCPQEHYKIELVKNEYGVIEDLITTQMEHKVTYNRLPLLAADRKEISTSYRPWDLFISICVECQNYTVWENDNIIFPITNQLPLSEEDMPDDVKVIYDEAAQVYQHSKRASAALLRLAIEVLLINHLNIKKSNINTMIGELVSKGVPDYIHKGLDALRYYGNKGIHFGQLDLNDNEEKVIFLFRLINTIVKELITKEKEIETFYAELPESFKQTIDKRNNAAKK